MSIKITYSTEEQLQQEHAKLLKILHNMRFYQKYWHLHFGHEAKKNKESWEQKADAILDQHGLVEHNNTKAVQVLRE